MHGFKQVEKKWFFVSQLASQLFQILEELIEKHPSPGKINAFVRRIPVPHRSRLVV